MHPIIRQSDRAFGLTFAAVFAIITAVAWFFFDAQVYWTMFVSGGFLAVALILPWILLPLNRLWNGLAGRFGAFNNAILLALFFFLVVTPMGVVMRLFGRDPMDRKYAADQPSYLTPVGRKSDPTTLSDMF